MAKEVFAEKPMKDIRRKTRQKFTAEEKIVMRSLDSYDILDPKVIDDPYPFYAALREKAPVYEVPGTEVFLVSTRRLIEEALEREDDFSANLTGTLMTGADGKAAVFDMAEIGGAADAIANADEPAHAVHRKLLLPCVTPKVIASLEETLRAWAVELMQPLLDAGRGDWVAAVANPLPARAMALVVGLPQEDVDRLLVWAMTGTEVLAGTTTPERMAAVTTETAGMAVYLHEQLADALARPDHRRRAGMIGELARGVKQGLISMSDGVSILLVLAGAGSESTSSLTGSAVRILAEDPKLQEELRARPSRIPDFVEEAVRLESSFRGHYRAVKRDTRLGDVNLPKGSRIFLLWAAANREPEIYDKPAAVDVERTGTRDHLAFGKGTHFCIGARLARLEERVILEELLARTRSFAPDPERPPQYVKSIFVRRHATLDLIIDDA